MTEFYKPPTRKAMQTAPSVKMRSSISKAGSRSFMLDDEDFGQTMQKKLKQSNTEHFVSKKTEKKRLTNITSLPAVSEGLDIPDILDTANLDDDL